MTQTPDDRDPEDDLWQSIVDNYGERPDIDAEDEGPDPDMDTDPDTPAQAWFSPTETDDGFVPPQPPPPPKPQGWRAAAWSSVGGVPLIWVILALGGITVPRWFLGLLVVCFVAGFSYLISTMNRDPRDPWDDGAQV